jgi:hypothetical protein
MKKKNCWISIFSSCWHPEILRAARKLGEQDQGELSLKTAVPGQPILGNGAEPENLGMNLGLASLPAPTLDDR